MAYVAKHKKNCKDQSRYLIIKRVKEVQDHRGVTLDNSDRGFVMYIRCADCLCPAKWEK